MRNKFTNFYSFYSIALIAVIFATVGSVAAQVRPYRVTDRQVQTILTRLETRTDTFKRQVDTALNRNGVDNVREDPIRDYITDFENATDSLKRNFDARRSVKNDVSEVLNRATFIDQFMKNNRLTVAAQNQWRNVAERFEYVGKLLQCFVELERLSDQSDKSEFSFNRKCSVPRFGLQRFRSLLTTHRNQN